ncbi:hypothetical protein [Desulfurococcus amylolyticus]|uniref:Oligopeptide ABC transporter (Permease) n=1 Tax=Desulfurococcus amylolyticus DSM 16532 TaxID=768672 RepID=I3XSJ0_DESAM|nr:hypothetical protein [Desulfurococcus amylolyticus]AFL66914.1 oligopeptide ABC transporter (permease) [Desulfurococcus amylolyticus DSM 16532]
MPFTTTYLIGLLLGLIALVTKQHSTVLTIAGSILMILGIVGAFLEAGVAYAIGASAGMEVSMEWGMGFALLATIVYMVVGAVIAKKM